MKLPICAPAAGWPDFVSFGEALTDMIRVAPDQWLSVNGGAPWNVARAMSSLGVPSAFGGAISADVFGDALLAASRSAGLDLRFIQPVSGKSPLLAMVHQLTPPQYFFVGDDSADLHFHPEALPSGWRESMQWAHFGGISLAREPLATRLLALAQSLKAAGKRISYDSNFRAAAMNKRYDETLQAMCRLADLIKVSDEDLRGLFRSDSIDAGLAQIRAWNPRALLLLTQGAEGATLWQDEQVFRARPPQIEVVDSVGAGDASMAGVLLSLMQAPDAEPCKHLRWAVAAGAAACQSAGASALSRAQIEALLPQVRFKA
ncbi:carbohydrate kinase family protein [Roseateles sp.]|uniref:carbohydrate kinase family protein n=1 Tax=Roseateles sp. TaxID=1971397 RepID=UPI003BA80DA7